MSDAADPFFEPYDRDEVAYGSKPSAAVAAFLRQTARLGRAVDLGAGAGRDTLALAAAGYDVTAIDLSRRGLERILERADAAGVGDRVSTCAADVRDAELPPESLAAVVATTVLDHLPSTDAYALWQRITASLAAEGMLYAEVHTVEDPASGVPPGAWREAPISETAGAVIHYFAPNQLARWALEPEARLRILRYEERLEWDYTHGPEHLHGKAVLLAVRAGSHPEWYGQPPAFPRRGESRS